MQVAAAGVDVPHRRQDRVLREHAAGRRRHDVRVGAERRVRARCRRPARSSGSSSPTARTRRGVAYWPGDAKTPARILGVVAGRGCWRSMRRPASWCRSSARAASSTWARRWRRRPSVYKDILITPATAPVIRAWNARTGALVWTFDLDRAARRSQQQDVGKRLVEDDRRHQHVGLPDRSTSERGIVYIPVSIAGENDYVGVDAARRQSLWHLARRRRHRDRQAPVAPATRASRHLGLRPRRGTDADRRRRETARRFRPSRRSPRWACCSSSIASPASRCSAWKSGRCRRARCRARRRRRRSRSR